MNDVCAYSESCIKFISFDSIGCIHKIIVVKVLKVYTPNEGIFITQSTKYMIQYECIIMLYCILSNNRQNIDTPLWSQRIERFKGCMRQEICLHNAL